MMSHIAQPVLSSARNKILSRPYRILLIGGSVPDASQIEQTLRPDQNVRLYAMQEGTVALRFLLRHPPYEAAPLPDLILVCPPFDHALIAEIKQHSSLRNIPVIRPAPDLQPLSALVDRIRHHWGEPLTGAWGRAKIAEA